MDRDIYFEKVKGLLCAGFDYCTSIDYDIYAQTYEKEIDILYNAGVDPETTAQRIVDIENGELPEDLILEI